MAINDDLAYAVRDMSTPVYAEKEADIIAAYQKEYPGKEGRSIAWKKHLREDILAQRGITPENTDKKEYARQSKNLGKRFESRAGKEKVRTKSENAAEYKALGESLPPVGYEPPEGGIDVTFVGEAMISQNEWEGSFTIHVGKDTSTFTDAKGNSYSMPTGDFFKNPDMSAVFKTYFKGQDMAHSYQGDIFVN